MVVKKPVVLVLLALVIVQAAILYFLLKRKGDLVIESPDGLNRVAIQATDSGSKVWVIGPTGTAVMSSSINEPPTIGVFDKSGGIIGITGKVFTYVDETGRRRTFEISEFTTELHKVNMEVERLSRELKDTNITVDRQALAIERLQRQGQNIGQSGP